MSDVPLLEHCQSSQLRAVSEDAALGAFHDLLVHPPNRRGDAQLPQQHREDGLDLQVG